MLHHTSMPCSPETTLRVILSLMRSSGVAASELYPLKLGITFLLSPLFFLP
jgi:hypothetical protein